MLIAGFAIIPFSLFLLDSQEKRTVARIIKQETATAGILARSTLNILMMNGGDISSSLVDVKDMIKNLKDMQSEGLVYADAVFLSSKDNNEGRILGSIIAQDDEYLKFFGGKKFVTQDTLKRIKKNKKGYREITFGPKGRKYLEFTALGVLKDNHPVCAGRIIYSRSRILSSITTMKKILMIAAMIAIIIVSIGGALFSRVISKPVEELQQGARQIEKGNFTHHVTVKTNDELGSLADTFNHMSIMINNKIQELEAKNKELSKMDKLKDEFLANTSHELRTPIHGIIGIADSLKMGVYGNLADEVNSNLNLIVKSGNRLSSLVDDILDYSRLKHHDVFLKFVDVDIGSLADVVVSMVKPLARNKYLLIQNRITPGEFIINGDESRIQQIFFNLLGNAIKFTDEGEVTVEGQINPENSNEIIVTVKDTGIGIPRAKINEIFNSFKQVDGTSTRSYGGTGLGLTIARDLVHLHGGTIHVKSEEGTGSTFSFTLPVTAANGESPGVLQTGKSLIEPIFQAVVGEETSIVTVKGTLGDSENRPHVLVVDDEEINLQVMANYLSYEGYRVSMSTGGLEALDLIDKEELPDIVLLDVMMPVMSGYQVCKILRETYPSYQLPVLMLTAKNRSQDLEAGFEAGANDYLSKPFDRRELITRVKNLVDLKRNVEVYNELSILKEELTIAQKIQESIIPLKEPEVRGVSIKARYVPMAMVGGDFFDFYHDTGQDVLGVIIADVTGHGVPAALIASMLKAAFSLSREISRNPAHMLENLNSFLYNHISSRFVTACYAFFDIKRKILTISTAAHWPVYLLRRHDGTLQELRTRGTLMGLQKETQYHEIEHRLMAGDRILFITDGIIEERNNEKEIFGEQRLRKFVYTTADMETAAIPDELLSTLKTWAGHSDDGAFEDDISIVVVDVL